MTGTSTKSDYVNSFSLKVAAGILSEVVVDNVNKYLLEPE